MVPTAAPGEAPVRYPDRVLPRDEAELEAAERLKVRTDISATSDIAGFIGACLVDSESGLLLASEGGEDMDMEAEAALNTMVVKAETEVIERSIREALDAAARRGAAGEPGLTRARQTVVLASRALGLPAVVGSSHSQ